MKFIFQSTIIITVSWIAVLFLPWYSIAVVAFAFGYLLKSNANFLSGFLGVGLLWILKLIISSNDSELPHMVAEIFQLEKEIWLMLIAALMAGLTAGLACLAGSLLKVEKKRKYY